MSRYVLESAKESATLKPATRKILRLQELTSSELLSHGWVKRWRCVQLEAHARLVEKRFQTSFRATPNLSFQRVDLLWLTFRFHFHLYCVSSTSSIMQAAGERTVVWWYG
jgi:hypothetical protein